MKHRLQRSISFPSTVSFPEGNLFFLFHRRIHFVLHLSTNTLHDLRFRQTLGMLDVVVGVRNIVQSGCREVTDANEKLEVDEVGPDATKGDRKRFGNFGDVETVGS